MAKRKAQPRKRGKAKATPKRRTSNVYQRALKKFTRLNKQLPDGVEIPYERRIKFAQEVSAKFKGKPKSSILQSDIQKQVDSTVRNIFPRNLDECNLAVALSANAPWLENSFAYWQINSALEDLPKCIYVRVNAGIYGIAEFYMLEYNYTESGVKDIVEAIREQIGSLSSDEVDTYFFSPVVQVFDGKENDGVASSYFLEYQLHDIDNLPDSSTVYLPQSREQTKSFNKRVSKLVRKYARAVTGKISRKSSNKGKIKKKSKAKIKKRKK